MDGLNRRHHFRTVCAVGLKFTKFCGRNDRVAPRPSHLGYRTTRETSMYVSPKLTTFGTLREITLAGNSGPFDTVGNRDGCNVNSTGTRCS